MTAEVKGMNVTHLKESSSDREHRSKDKVDCLTICCAKQSHSNHCEIAILWQLG